MGKYEYEKLFCWRDFLYLICKQQFMVASTISLHVFASHTDGVRVCEGVPGCANCMTHHGNSGVSRTFSKYFSFLKFYHRVIKSITTCCSFRQQTKNHGKSTICVAFSFWLIAKTTQNMANKTKTIIHDMHFHVTFINNENRFPHFSTCDVKIQPKTRLYQLHMHFECKLLATFMSLT